MLSVSLRSATRWRSLMLGLALSAGACVQSGSADTTLPAFNAMLTQTSISGISSGAYMAVQFGTAWSSIIKGVGAIAGGPYGCSEGSGSQALSTCMDGTPEIKLANLIRRTDAFGTAGAIDPLANIAGQKIYLFNGYNDKVVARPVTDQLRAFYAHYLGASPGNLFYQTAIGAGHSQVTLAFGNSCAENGGEYINKCGYNQAGVILQHIYGALKPPNRGTLGGKILSFRQAEFTAPDKPNDDSMDDTGFAYVPAACAAHEACVVHVALHGCLQSVGNIKQDFVRHSGYNEWADSNHVIVLYPQIKAVTLTSLGITNPQACWDWWGYLDADPTEKPTYLLKTGKQITAIKRMIDRLTSGRPVPPATAAVPQAAARAADRSDSAVDLVWTAIPAASRYAVFRAEPADPAFKQIGTVAGLSYGDSGLHPATAYRYKVGVAASGGAEPASPVVTVTTLRKVPKCDDPGSCAVH